MRRWAVLVATPVLTIFVAVAAIAVIAAITANACSTPTGGTGDQPSPTAVHEIPAQLPGWTETDLYVEITRRWLEISEAGAQSGPHEAAHAVLEESERRPPRAS